MAMKFIFSKLCFGIFLLSFLYFFLLGLDAKEIPSLERRVTWEEGTISNREADFLENILKEYEEKTSNQFAILIVHSLEGEILEEYSLKVAETWKLGQKGIDNGVLILLATEDKKVRIEVGYGLEGVLTDVYCKRVIRDFFIPQFRNGDYEEGLRLGLKELLETADLGITPEEPSFFEEFQSFRGFDFKGNLFLYPVGMIFVSVLFLFGFITSFHYEDQGVGMFVFVLVFFQWVPTMFFGYYAWLGCNLAYIFGFIFVRLTRNQLNWVKKMAKKVTDNVHFSSGGFSGRSGSGSSGGSSGGFSGGGGSFGGGGASGSW
ncbi:PF04536 family protein [Leptospira yanagawae serovar Saopaulo str. Sao Paulo = ATCC 700523]|uniref:PF04536 family protein n=2 Tax=Leptospira yanagawae TaxID=293069 RepID=A0A5E8H8U6_9LEPT|nr:PF04536 family protein [Leptospira yanagawae serovar Saopaulo str. Sao Paulo = ATCC 700523]